MTAPHMNQKQIQRFWQYRDLDYQNLDMCSL